MLLQQLNIICQRELNIARQYVVELLRLVLSKQGGHNLAALLGELKKQRNWDCIPLEKRDWIHFYKNP